MAHQTFTVLMNILMIVGGIFALYGVWFCIIGFFGLKKSKPYKDVAPKTRFAVIVAARNERNVIGRLVDSLLAQDYPRSLFDVYIAPNNCTDDTREVALQHGALVFDPTGHIHAKGDVLAQIGDMLIETGKYDAMCVFDADNLVQPDFLKKMNNAYQDGAKLAQGRREAKNPTQTTMTAMYAVYYWVVNRFYNGGREALGLSSLLVGSGFMVCLQLLAEMGGWRTTTMTEDYEFTGQSVLMGEKVHYIAEAVYFDELPLTFMQSWKQRRRWCTGFVQGMEGYFTQLLSYAFKNKSIVAFDMAMAYIAPGLQLFSLLSGLASMILSAYGIVVFNLIPLTWAIWAVVGFCVLLILGCAAFAGLVVVMNARPHLKDMVKGIALFSLFLLSWMPISIFSLFFKKTQWEVIEHNGTVVKR